MTNVLSLFSGIGGIDLGLERAGMRVVAQCEIDPFCRAVLARHWPDVPRFSDVRELHADDVSGVDLVAGGFPCQDISSAGKGGGIHAARSGLWWEMRRIIGELRPSWLLIENVPALRTRGADDVLAALEELGYACTPLVVGAWSAGAPHKRNRVWIVAHGDSGRREGERSGRLLDGERAAFGHDADGCDGAPMADSDSDGVRKQSRGSSRPSGASTAEPGGCGEVVADACGERLEGRRVCSRSSEQEQPLPACGGVSRWPARPGEPQHEWEEPRLIEFPLGSAASGLPLRLVRSANRNALRAYGNAVVPQVVEAIGRAIMKANA